LPKLLRATPVALLVALACLIAAGPAAAAGTTTLTFKEPDKGSTFAFVDNPPVAKKVHGFPTAFTPGDLIIFTNPLEAEGKIVGKIRVTCEATQASSAKNFTGAGFLCNGIAKIPGGSLVFAAELSQGGTEGAIIGGTGRYAGATGTFVSKELKHASLLTITLDEEEVAL
jgi:hypothetical protein